ncbi:MAG: OmpH family outer membrane protein [Paracoccaceae bacterium]
MLRHLSAKGVLVAILLLLAGAGFSQEAGVVSSQILVLDGERAYLFSVAGQKITKDLEARLANLGAENRKIEADLEAEELELTEKRAVTEALEFRSLADAFDQKVRRIRAEQDAKQLELQRLRDADRQSFIESMSPIISRIAIERGALIILERRNVLLSAETVDITEEVIARINQSLTAPTTTPQLEDNELNQGSD